MLRQSRSTSEHCTSGSRHSDHNTLMQPTRSIILPFSTKSKASMPRRNPSCIEHCTLGSKLSDHSTLSLGRPKGGMCPCCVQRNEKLAVLLVSYRNGRILH